MPVAASSDNSNYIGRDRHAHGGKRPAEFSCASQVGDALSQLEAKSVFLVVDRLAYESSGARSQLAPHWEARNVVEFDAFQCNPRSDDVLKGVEQYRRTPCDVMVAVGGGTALDVAKLIRCFAAQRRRPTDIIADNGLIEKSACPLVAVPTTAGTGSEATHFAVLYVNGVKHSIAHHSIMPDAAVVDWRLTESVPPRITAETGLDALSQAIESIWCIHSTDESISYSVEALELILDHLETAVHAPGPAARAAMSRAAHLAGKAINITKTTAPHAISYKITHDFGIAHGHAVALTLGSVLVFNANATNSEVTDARGLEHVQEMVNLILSKLGCKDVEEGRARLTKLMESIGCAARLSQLDIAGQETLESIAGSVNVDRLKNNPRKMTTAQLMQLLESIQ
jgi:alcohol dehydrogenase class IV